MNRTEQLKKQHESINQLILETNKLVKEINLELNASEIAKNISTLAGILQIHLSQEDQYLYPSLMKSENPEVMKKAKMYMDEMGNLKSVYIEFKNEFNTKSKIMTNSIGFEKAFKVVFSAIEKRISREDSDLYLML
jgi:iron-sulfur cluster repair protein YtfE (RIC family)